VTLTVESIRNQDFPVVQWAVILLTLLIVSVNLVVDGVVGVIEPRIREKSEAPASWKTTTRSPKAQ
jgi:ABC-type dipeptide/oligopeptide/nickel transport system permease component